MEFESGLEPDTFPGLDEFVMARIAEDKRIAARAADTGSEVWDPEDLPPSAPRQPDAAEHVARFDPARVLAECAAKRGIVQACRDARPDTRFLGSRPAGLPDFPLGPADSHQLAALTLALLALPYSEHPDYREEWRP